MRAQPNDDLMAMADAVGVTASPGGAGYCPRHTVCPAGCTAQRAAAKALHPSMRGRLAADALAQLIDDWAAAAPIPFEVDTCPLCNDTGIYETRSALGGGQVHVTCPVCPRDHDQDGDR